MTTKEFVLKVLKENLNTTFSGEELASRCGVSRAAVWKAVNSLRAQGFLIEGLSNGGYIYKGDEDVFSKEKLTLFFKEDFPEIDGADFECFKEIDSTNTYAKTQLSLAGALRDEKGKLTENGKKFHKAIIVAESQTAGRGRFGRTFYSPSKTGIYITVIYVPEGGVKNPAEITASAAVAVSRGIKKVFAVEPEIKWINDIFCGGKKVCGILTEGIANFETGQIEAAIIGIGINIEANEIFPDEVKKVAGGIISSDSKTSEKINATRCKLASQVAGNVLKVLEEDFNQVLTEYKSRSFLIGKSVKVFPVIGEEKSAYEAKVLDIDQNAGLIVEKSDGTKKVLSSGEVSVRLG